MKIQYRVLARSRAEASLFKILKLNPTESIRPGALRRFHVLIKEGEWIRGGLLGYDPQVPHVTVKRVLLNASWAEARPRSISVSDIDQPMKVVR